LGKVKILHPQKHSISYGSAHTIIHQTETSDINIVTIKGVGRKISREANEKEDQKL